MKFSIIIPAHNAEKHIWGGSGIRQEAILHGLRIDSGL